MMCRTLTFGNTLGEHLCSPDPQPWKMRGPSSCSWTRSWCKLRHSLCLFGLQQYSTFYSASCHGTTMVPEGSFMISILLLYHEGLEKKQRSSMKLWSSNFFCVIWLKSQRNQNTVDQWQSNELKQSFSKLNGRARTQMYPVVLKWLTATIQAHGVSIFLWSLRKVEHPEMYCV